MSNQVQCPNCGSYDISIQDQGYGCAMLWTILLGGLGGLMACGVILLVGGSIFDPYQSFSERLDTLGSLCPAFIWLIIGWGPIIWVSKNRSPYLVQCDTCKKLWDTRRE